METCTSDIVTASKGGDDVICFTSGPSGAAFAAGVIHAWLAAHRAQPLVAAGISTGAISAAAMRRVYQELANAAPGIREQKRWEWYRRYLGAAIQNPTAAIWRSVPDPVDFFGTLPPVKDTSVPEELIEQSEDARRHYYLLTRLGVWLANLPVRVSTVATIFVMYVRKKENYGSRVQREWLFYWNLAKAFLGVSVHLLLSPTVIREGSFKGPKERHFWHPLFGLIWYVNLLVNLALAACIVFGALWVHSAVQSSQILSARPIYNVAEWIFAFMIGALALAVSVAGVALIVFWLFGIAKPNYWNEFLRKRIFNPLDITLGVLHPYEVTRQLYDLFCDDSAPPTQKAVDVQLLIVCAALEKQKDQVIVNPEPSLVEALSAAISIPGVFPPKEVQASSILGGDGSDDSTHKSYHLVDGAAIRANPIPAFFEWCKRPENRKLVGRIESASKTNPSLHVVYNVPIGYSGSAASAPPLTCPDIVQSAQKALLLEKRRDTRQEVRQTNYMSKLEDIRRKVTGAQRGARGPFSIFADEIAPQDKIDTDNFLTPHPDQLLQVVSSGCRATLETIYYGEILALNGGAPIACQKLLTRIVPASEIMSGASPAGLPEVCSGCCGLLKYRPQRKEIGPPQGIIWSYGNQGDPAKLNLRDQFHNLCEEKPNIVFLGSGGVFRGAFHIGVIAAMVETELYPDLVVGASVGALMGGALCHMTAGPKENETDVLVQLTDLFLNVDNKVALTRTLKNAVKQLGTRARSVHLSPSELSRMVEKGSQADPGFAATGAPPALIDAIASVFLIPHRETGDIASQFVAGHISEATMRFLGQLRKETLPSFEIESAVMGVSLLAGHARKLLGRGTKGVNLSSVQPYHDLDARRRVSCFSTTSFLNAGISILLGRDFLTTNPSWDGAYAGLSSSAFPAVFAPRTEADILPGRGRADRYFADGGLFDNLPFFPAIEILSAVQASDTTTDPKQIYKMLQNNIAGPNLFVAAGLNAKPRSGANYNTLFRIKDRADSLSIDGKTRSFSRASSKTAQYLGEITKPEHHEKFAALKPCELEFLKGSVCAKVVSISPCDPQHINPTFAFCRTTGLKKQRVQESIADGCFQSLAEFEKNKDISDLLPEKRKITRANSETKNECAKKLPEPQRACPFFLKGKEILICPFTRAPASSREENEKIGVLADVRNVYDRCTRDTAHRSKQKTP